MRLQTFATSALAAASLLLSSAAAQSDYVTSISTYTITRTVERVVETTWATMSPSSIAVDNTALPLEPTFSTTMASPAASASMAALPHYNGTKPALGSGALPSSTVSMSSGLPQATGNAAARMGSKSYAFAAIAGLLGLAVL